MYQTNLKWTADKVTCVIGGEVTRILQMSNDVAEQLFYTLSVRAASDDFNKDGTFDIDGVMHDMTAGVWASVLESLEHWYNEYFARAHADNLFADTKPMLRVVK